MNSTMRWARTAFVIGGLLLGAAIALIVWEAAADDPTPSVVITGDSADYGVHDEEDHDRHHEHGDSS